MNISNTSSFPYFSLETLRLFPNFLKDVENEILNAYSSVLDPTQLFKELFNISRVNKSFHTFSRAFQIKIFNTHLEIDSNKFISSFKSLLQFAKCYGVIKLSFPSLSEEACGQLVEGVPSLTHLRICDRVSKEGIQSLSRLQSLEHLEIETGNDNFQYFFSFRKLSYLKIKFQPDENPHVSLDESSSSIEPMSNLKRLELYGDISSSVFEKVVQLRGLEGVTLERGYYIDLSIDEYLKEISENFKQLLALKLIGWRIFDKEFEEICKITTLRKLYITSNDITEKGYEKLASLKNLQSLHWPAVDGKVLKVIGNHLEKLESLSLSGSPSLTDKGLMHLKSLVHLRRLNIFSCSQIVGKSFLELAKHLKGLKSLNISHFFTLTDEGFQGLLKFKNLEKLIMNFCEWVEDRHIQEMSEQLPCLRILSIRSLHSPFDEEHLQKKYLPLRIDIGSYFCSILLFK